MTTGMSGPYTDEKPPRSGMRHKWKFRNNSGESIHDLHVRVGGPGNPPLMDAIEISDGRGNVLASNPTVGGGSIDHLTFDNNESVGQGMTFQVKVKLRDVFEEGDWIEFSPTDPDGVSIIAGTSSQPEGLRFVRGEVTGLLAAAQLQLARFVAVVSVLEQRLALPTASVASGHVGEITQGCSAE